MSTIFITGKVGKSPDKTIHDRFKQMEESLKSKGYTNFFYPCKLEDDCNLTKEQAMKADIINMLTNAEALYLDSTWSSSKRSVMLRDLALKIGMDVLYRH